MEYSEYNMKPVAQLFVPMLHDVMKKCHYSFFYLKNPIPINSKTSLVFVIRPEKGKGATEPIFETIDHQHPCENSSIPTSQIESSNDLT